MQLLPKIMLVAALHGVTLPPDDPFWNEYYPPLGWNCRCTVVQVRRGKYAESDSHAATAAGRQATAKTPSFRFNPGKQRKCFPDNVSYLKHAGANKKEREKAEIKCENMNKTATIKKAVELLSDKIAECTINNQQYKVEFIRRGIDHYCHDLSGKKNIYWIKNEVLPKIDKYLKEAEYVGRKECDRGHNTNKETLRLKKQTDYFYYFKIKLPNGENCYLHLGMYNEHKIGKQGMLYLYSISKNAPNEMENQ